MKSVLKFITKNFTVLVLLSIAIGAILAGRNLWPLLAQFWEREKKKSSKKTPAEKLEDAKVEVRGAREIIRDLRGDINAFIEDNGRLPKLDDNGDPIPGTVRGK